MSIRHHVLTVHPASGDHRVAGRAGLSVAVPLLLLWAGGHLEWAIFAAFGAFAALYARTHAGGPRLRMQVAAGAVLTAATTLGVVVGLSEHRAWISVPVAALIAVAVSLLSRAHAWHPPGALFAVFSFAAVASIPSEAVDVPVAFGIAGSSAAFALLVGNVGWVVRTLRTGSVPRLGPRPVRPARARGERVDAVRAAFAVGVAVLAAAASATAIGVGHPYWAAVSAAVPFGALRFEQQLVRGVQRLLGTALGLVAAGGLLLLDPRGLALVLLVVALQVAAEMLIGRHYALALVAITPLALLMVHLVAPVPTRVLLVDRGVETLVGVAIGLAVGYAARRRPEPR